MAESKRLGLVVGLGNPGRDYERTRHNAGCWFVEALADRLGATFRNESRFSARVARGEHDGETVWLLAPDTFMNDSGRAVAACASYYRISAAATLVAHDELSLAPGDVRIKRGGGHGGHNGLRDVASHLGRDFVRLRIGIGRPRDAVDVARYVLKPPSAEDRALIDRAIASAVDESGSVLAGDVRERAIGGRRER